MDARRSARSASVYESSEAGAACPCPPRGGSLSSQPPMISCAIAKLRSADRRMPLHPIATHMNLPNALTIMRIFLVPLLVVVLLTKFDGRVILGVPKELVGAAIFGVASF